MLLKLKILLELLQTKLTQVLGPDHRPETEFKLVFARTFATKTYACHAHNGIVPLGPFEFKHFEIFKLFRASCYKSYNVMPLLRSSIHS